MGKHAKHDIHDNSRDSWREEKPRVYGRRQQILSAFRTAGTLTDRGVANFLGWEDMNKVRPRITEMVDDGTLVEVGSVYCQKTRRLVRLLRRAG